MPLTYKVYFLDAKDQVLHQHALECDSDDHAVERLQQMDWGSHGVEIWQDERLVRRFDPPPPG